MVILVTNITDESLNDEIIEESFNQTKTYKGKIDISEIIFLKPAVEKKQWNLSIESDVPVKEYEIYMDDKLSEIYKKLDDVLDPLFEANEFIQVIVDSSILGFYMLDSMKKFKVKEVFILKANTIEKFHTCICNV